MNYYKKLSFLFLGFFLFSCTKTKEIAKGLNSKISSADLSVVKKEDQKSVSNIYKIHTSGLFQRGFRIFKENTTTVGLVKRGVSSLVVLSDGNTHISVPIKKRLTASFTKDQLSQKDIQGFSVFLIAKEKGEDLKMILAPEGQTTSMPSGYVLKSDRLWYILVVQGNRGKKIADFTDLGNGLNYYFFEDLYQEKDKRALNKSISSKEIKGIFDNAPSFARYIILDITLVIKNQKQEGMLEIFLDRGNGRKQAVDKMLFAKSDEQRIYRKSVIIPVLNQIGSRKASIIKVQTKGLSSMDEKDAYGYFYVKGWKTVNHF